MELTAKREYNHKVLLGNWREQVALENELEKEFQEKSKRGELLEQKHKKLTDISLREVKTEKSNFVIQNSLVHLENTVQPGKMLSLALNIKEMPALEAVTVTAALNHASTTRNTFKIHFQGDKLVYGQKFTLQSVIPEIPIGSVLDKVLNF